jgi:thiamine pyrophosphokinase
LNQVKRCFPETILMGPVSPAPAWTKKTLSALKKKHRRLGIVGVDGGVLHAVRAGWISDIQVVIGDGDSLPGQPHPDLVNLRSNGKRFEIPRILLSVDKDQSDTAVAATWAVDHGARRLHAVGLEGGRPDHHLAVVADLSRLPVPVILYGKGATYYFLNSASHSAHKLDLKLRRGQTVSIFSLSDRVAGVTLRGFHFPLRGQTIFSGSRGLSNFVTNPRGNVHVEIERGRLVVVVLDRLEYPGGA